MFKSYGLKYVSIQMRSSGFGKKKTRKLSSQSNVPIDSKVMYLTARNVFTEQPCVCPRKSQVTVSIVTVGFVNK